MYMYQCKSYCNYIAGWRCASLCCSFCCIFCCLLFAPAAAERAALLITGDDPNLTRLKQRCLFLVWVVTALLFVRMPNYVRAVWFCSNALCSNRWAKHFTLFRNSFGPCADVTKMRIILKYLCIESLLTGWPVLFQQFFRWLYRKNRHISKSNVNGILP